MAPTYEWTTEESAGMSMAAERATFLKRVYGHLLGAVIAFVVFELLMFKMGWAEAMARAMFGTNTLLLFGGFVLVSWLATRFAATAASPALQYVGLFAYVVLQGVIFVPLLAYAQAIAPGTIESAGLITVLAFAGLTAVVMISGRDFSFLGSILKFAGIMAIVTIVGALLFGATLGTWFSVAMVGLAGAAILYDTSNILHHYPTDRYVGASLALFASVALMFYYVLRILLASRR
jgi:FtsH-binding integral membrane protein